MAKSRNQAGTKVRRPSTNPSEVPSPPPSAPLIDAAGAEHRPAGPEARILSLVPSLTELLFALGLGPRVVGRTRFCVLPQDRVAAVETVGGTKTVKMEKVLALRPSHAVVNIDETPKELAQALAGQGIRVIVTHPVEVTDNPGLYRLLGGIFGAEAEARALTAQFEESYRSVCSKRPKSASRRAASRRVVYLIWKKPWMTVSGDTYISRMLSLIGWQTAAHPASGGPADRYPEIALADDRLAETDLVLFSTEPFPFTEKHVAEFRADFPAHAAKARLVDGRLLGWYGSRAIEGLRYLEELAAAEGPYS